PGQLVECDPAPRDGDISREHQIPKAEAAAVDAHPIARAPRRGVEPGPLAAERAHHDVHRAVVERSIRCPQRLEYRVFVTAAAEADQGPSHALAVGATGRP